MVPTLNQANCQLALTPVPPISRVGVFVRCIGIVSTSTTTSTANCPRLQTVFWYMASDEAHFPRMTPLEKKGIAEITKNSPFKKNHIQKNQNNTYTYMEVSWNGGFPQQPWVFLLKMIILGWRLGGTTRKHPYTLKNGINRTPFW